MAPGSCRLKPQAVRWVTVLSYFALPFFFVVVVVVVLLSFFFLPLFCFFCFFF